jgi:NTP pyrophosphatase (non-canonical NTP hydrolase)
MNPNVYQAQAQRTEADPCKSASRMESLLPVDPNSPDSLHLMPVRINHAVVGLAGEVGELAQLLERWVYYGQSLSIPDVEEEVGDCLWYLALLCTAVGVPMERAMERNLAKLKARFPHKFTEEAAANRDPAAERKASDEAMERAKAEVDRYGEPGMPPGPERKASDEAMERAKADWVSAYADGLKDLTERYGGVSDKPVSEIYPPPHEKMNRYAVQYGAAGKTPPASRQPISLPHTGDPDVWVCECGQINADRRIVCGWCNVRRKGHEDWVCECGHVNLAVDPRCAKCDKHHLTVVLEEQQDNLVRQAETVMQSPQQKDRSEKVTRSNLPPAPLKPQEESEDKGHDWKDPARVQTTCTKCGAYRHLSSGTMRCKGHPPDQENTFGYDDAGEFEDL